MANKDVELVIRAKNEASKALEAISNSLKELTDRQKNFGDTAGKTNSLLSTLGEELSKLGKQASGASVFDKLTSSVDKANSAVTRLDEALKKSSSEQQRLATETAQTEAAIAGLHEEIAATSAALTKERESLAKSQQAHAALSKDVQVSERELNKLGTEATKLATKLNDQNAALVAAKDKHTALANEIGKSDSVTKRMQNSLSAAAAAVQRHADAIEKTKKAQNENAAALETTGSALVRLKGQFAESAIAIKTQGESIDSSAVRLRNLQDQAKASEAQLRKLNESSASVSATIKRQNADLTQAKAELVAVTEAAARSDASLTKLATTLKGNLLKSLQDQKAALATLRAEWQATTERIGQIKLSPGGINSAELTAALAAAKQAKTGYLDLQQAVAKLAQNYRAAGGDVQKLGALISQFSGVQADAKAKVAALTEAVRAQQEAAAKDATSQGQATAEARKAISMRAALLRALVDERNALKALASERAGATSKVASLGGLNVASDQNAKAIEQARAIKEAYRAQQIAVAQMAQAVRAAGNDVAALAAAEQTFAAAMASAKAKIDAAKGSLTQHADVTKQVTVAKKQASSASSGFAKVLEDLNRDSREAMSYYQRLRGEVIALGMSYASITGAVNGIKAVIKASIDLQSVQSRLNVATGGDKGQTAAEFAWLKSEADRLGVSLSTLATEWSKFSVATKGGALSAQESRKVFTSVTEAGRVLNLDATRLSQALLAITQMASKGSIQMEELRGQLGEHLPGAFSIMADAVGVSEAKLLKMMEAGQVTSRALVKFADELDRRFKGQLPDAIQQTQAEIGRFQTQFTLALQAIGNAGVLEAFTNQLRRLTSFLKSDEGAAWFKDVGAAAAGAINVLGFFAENIRAIISLVGLLVGVKLGAWVVGIVESMIAMRAALAASRVEVAATTAAMNTASVAARGFSAALAMVGGWPGLIITGMGLLVSGLAAYVTRTKESSVATEEHSRVVAELRTQYMLAAGDAAKFTEEQKRAWSYSATRGIEDAKRQVEDFKNELKLPKISLLDGDNLDFSFELKQLKDIVAATKAGKLSISEMTEKLAALRLASGNTAIRKFIDDVMDSAKEAKNAEARITDYTGVLDTLNGKTDTAASAQLGLKKNLEGVEDGAKRAKNALEAYKQALNDPSSGLRSFVPAEQDGLKRDDQINKAGAAAQRALTAAAPDLGDKFQVAMREATDKVGRDTTKLFDALVTAFGPVEKEAEKVAEVFGTLKKAIDAANNEYRTKRENAIPLDNKAIRERIIFVESGGDPLAKNDKSSAAGSAQFTNETWLDLFDKVFPELANESENFKLAMRSSTEASNKMTDALIRQNQAALVQAGQKPDATNTYLAHFLGAQGAIKVLVANPKELAANILSPEAVRANPNVLGGGKTAGDVISYANKKMGGGSPIESGGATRQEVYDAQVLQRVVELQKENAAASRESGESKLESNRALQIEVELEKWIAEARKQGVVLSEQQRIALSQQIALKYDIAHADDAQKAREKEVADAVKMVTGLYQQRKALLGEIALAVDVGDVAAAERLRAKLVQVNDELRKAIPAAQTLADNLGGPVGEKAKGQVGNVDLNLKKDTTDKVFDANAFDRAVVQNGSTAFDSFGKTISDLITKTTNAKGALRSLGDTLLSFVSGTLQDTAKNMFSNLLTNALKGDEGLTQGLGEQLSGLLRGAFSGMKDTFSEIFSFIASAFSSMMGGSGGGLMSALFHSGGVVGNVGGQSRAVSPGWFANAVRYHEGGLAGLKPGEVPAILKENEEVLTRDNPRHILNGGGQPGAAAQPLNVKVVNTIDAGEFVSQGAGTTAGEKAIMNVIKSNSSAIRAMVK